MCFPKSAIKLAILSFIILFSGVSSAAESNKDKLKKMLDNANKPQAVSSIPADFLDGLWVGYYDYDSNQPNPPSANSFSAVFEQTANNIEGVMLEPYPENPQVYAQFAEIINASVSDKTLTFTKKYQSGNTVNYSVSIDVNDRAMSGRWKVSDSVSGTVKMWRMDVQDMKKL